MNIKKLTAVAAALLLVLLSAAACGKKPAAPPQSAKAVTVSRSNFVPSTNIIDIYTQYPERFTDKVASSFEMGNEAKESFFSAPEEWLAYEIVLSAKNPTDKTVTLFGLNVADNGKDGVYIQTQLEDGVTLSAGAEGSVSVTVLCSNGDLSDAQAKTLADSFALSAAYYTGTGSDEIPAETFTAVIE